jgi:dimethylhistidine N-methyltransferase
MAIRNVVVPAIADDVSLGLTRTPKLLPPKLFYDAVGSALFEEISRLPEYYLTRTELGILRERAAEIARHTTAGASIIELGSGSSAKTRVLLDAFSGRSMQLAYYPVDISPTALHEARQTLRREMPAVRVAPIIADLAGDLNFLREIPGPRLVLYIGSSIGNMEREEASGFLRRLHSHLDAGDALLLGTDLVKDRETLLDAYNDSAGVTARFNLNLLARINRELGGHFDLQAFRHVAIWNGRKSRIEMYLESLREQEVAIDMLGMRIPFARGERIHTENSHKYNVGGARGMLREAGFTQVTTWCDEKKWFAVHFGEVMSTE